MFRTVCLALVVITLHNPVGLAADLHNPFYRAISVIFKPDPLDFPDPDAMTPATIPAPTNAFGVDLLNAIHDMTGLIFLVQYRRDLIYGTPQQNGSWAGTLLAPLLNNEADLVGPELVITSYGQQVVDFLVPINSFKLQVLYNTVRGLTENTQYAVAKTESMIYLQNTTNVEAQAVWTEIQEGLPYSILPADNTGEDLILDGDYAVVVESQNAAGIIEGNDGKISIAPGDVGGPFFLSMAVSKGSPIRDIMNSAIMQLSESGMLEQLLKKNELFAL